MPNSKRIAARRRNLLAQDPRCYYCRRAVRYYPLAPREVPPDDFATIEHIYHRNLGPRPEVGRQVLCCYRCNQDKGTADQQIAQQGEVLLHGHLTFRIGDLLGEAG